MGSCTIINPTDDYVKAKVARIEAKIARANGDAIVTSDDSPIQHGGSSLFNYADGPMKWTDHMWKGVTIVPYCFEDEGSRIVGKDRVEAAIKLYIDALGGERSPASGHSIRIIECYNYK
jgi:hypothetical protein